MGRRRHLEIPAGGAEGPLLVMGGDTNGWSLYIKDGKPTFCYNLAAIQLTYIRADKALSRVATSSATSSRSRGRNPSARAASAGSCRRAEGRRGGDCADVGFGYSLDETFDVGCDKGAPVTDEYPTLAAFTGKIVRIDIDLAPDIAGDETRHAKERFAQAMLRQ